MQPWRSWQHSHIAQGWQLQASYHSYAIIFSTTCDADRMLTAQEPADELMDDPSAALEVLAAQPRYNRLAIARELLDHQYLLELGAHWGTAADTVFGRLEGQSVGIVAPAADASKDASHKASPTLACPGS